MMITQAIPLTTHCNNLKPNQKIPPSIRECGARPNEEAKLHFLYTERHIDYLKKA